MLEHLSEQARRLATPRRTWVSLILLLSTMAAVNFADLPFTGPRLSRLTDGMKFLDLLLYYSTEEVWATISSYGPAGRTSCLGFYATWDVAIPLLAFTFSTLTLAQLWGNEGRKHLLFLAPVAALTFDLLENFLLSLVLSGFPSSPKIVASAAGLFTLLKWLAYGTSAGLLLAGSGRVFRNRHRNSA